MASSIHFDRMCGFASQGDSVDAEEGASRAQKDRGQVMNAQERKKPRISSHFLPSLRPNRLAKRGDEIFEPAVKQIQRLWVTSAST